MGEVAEIHKIVFLIVLEPCERQAVYLSSLIKKVTSNCITEKVASSLESNCDTWLMKISHLVFLEDINSKGLEFLFASWLL